MRINKRNNPLTIITQSIIKIQNIIFFSTKNSNKIPVNIELNEIIIKIFLYFY